MEHRVVVTGLGAITPIGNTVNDFFENVKLGVCGIDFISRFDTEGYDVKLAAAVKEFDPAQYMDLKEAKRLDRFSQFAVAAAVQAILDACLDVDKIDKDRFGVIGIGHRRTGMHRKGNKDLMEKGPEKGASLVHPYDNANMAAGNIAIRFGARGICSSVVTACATGTHCIGEAFRSIKHGYSDLILAGGGGFHNTAWHIGLQRP